jgi:hypothetical protein
MKLYVEAMDSTVVDVDVDGRIRLADDEWIQPSLQERRAILYAAANEIDALNELTDILNRTSQPSA